MQTIIKNLNINNIKNLNYNLDLTKSTVITGWSGSGKSSFVNALYNEAKRKFILLLPKSEYSFIFKNDQYKATKNSLSFYDTPFIVNIENKVTSNTPKATIGTFTGILKTIRQKFAKEHNKSSEFFSFNIPISWCPKCKGKSTFRNQTCSTCLGTRYSKDIEQYKISTNIGTMNIINILSLPMDKISKIANDLDLTNQDKIKLENCKNLNIDYLSLDRSIITLSGGEYARLILANYLNLSENIVYVIDEPSIGLDSQNISNLIDIFNELGNKNQIFLIDHNKIIRNATENTIMFGEKSGIEGGKIVSNIKVTDCENFNKNTSNNSIQISDIKNRNIELKDLNIPLNSLNIITGESGVGKSSLVEVLLDKINSLKDFESIHIEQNKLRGITKKSTIATYLGFMDELKKYAKIKIDECNICNGTGLDIDNIGCLKCNATGYDNSFLEEKIQDLPIRDILTLPIDYIYDKLPKKLQLNSLTLLKKLSNGYLSLDRKVNTLSGGEFQRLYLSKQLNLIFTSNSKKEYLIFLDEPSKGLSQNYINDLLLLLKNILKEHKNITFVAIEHNECVINNADYILDMGKRREKITDLLFIENVSKLKSKKINKKFTSKLGRNQVELDFKEAKQQYKNLLKIYSKTAEWIYSDIGYKSNLNPVISLDFENDNLYSKNTRLYETLNIYPYILKKLNTNYTIFNLTDKSNVCKLCKGSGKVESFDFDFLFKDTSKSLFQGLISKEILEIIKPYNLDKIKSLFRAIKKDFGFDLSKAYNKMNNEEKSILKYGFLNKQFIFKSKKGTSYLTWRGLNHLINKYLRTYKKNNQLKEEIKSTLSEIECPKCNGEIFNHDKDIEIDNISIRDYLKQNSSSILKGILEEELFEIYISKIGDISLNSDVSELDKTKQIYLKLIEIVVYSIQNYHIHIKNISDYLSSNEKILKLIEDKNLLYLHDDFSIQESKNQLFQQVIKKYSLKKTSMVYEAFNIKPQEVKKVTNALKKQNPCIICKGKGKFIIENPIDELDTETIKCSKCNGIGIEENILLEQKINNFSLWDIYFGSCQNIQLNQKISSLSKEELKILLDI